VNSLHKPELNCYWCAHGRSQERMFVYWMRKKWFSDWLNKPPLLYKTTSVLHINETTNCTECICMVQNETL